MNDDSILNSVNANYYYYYMSSVISADLFLCSKSKTTRYYKNLYFFIQYDNKYDSSSVLFKY